MRSGDVLRRDVLRMAFASRGWEVELTGGVAEALRALSASGAPDVILVDKNLPDGSGVELVRQIRARDHAVGVVLMTAYGTSSTTIEAMHLGAYDYITKPFDVDRVLFTIRRYFERQQLAQELVRSRQEGKALSERIVGNTPLGRRR